MARKAFQEINQCSGLRSGRVSSPARLCPAPPSRAGWTCCYLRSGPTQRAAPYQGPWASIVPTLPRIDWQLLISGNGGSPLIAQCRAPAQLKERTTFTSLLFLSLTFGPKSLTFMFPHIIKVARSKGLLYFFQLQAQRGVASRQKASTRSHTDHKTETPQSLKLAGKIHSEEEICTNTKTQIHRKVKATQIINWKISSCKIGNTNMLKGSRLENNKLLQELELQTHISHPEDVNSSSGRKYECTELAALYGEHQIIKRATMTQRRFHAQLPSGILTTR